MTHLLRISVKTGILLFGLFPGLGVTAEGEPLPKVLTLEYALKQATADHPQMQIIQAEVEKARAERLSVDAFAGLESGISGRLMWVDPPDIAYDQDQGDHKLSLYANKRLYDFGYTASLEEAAEAGVTSKEHLLNHALNKHRIAIMAAYFDVLLADQIATRDREEMTVAYLTFDKARDRHELGMVSDIDLLELESISQAKLVTFRQSELRQFTARTNLANILNMPGKPQADIETPELKSNNRKIPDDVEDWMAVAEKQNPMLLALQSKVLAANKRLASGRGITNPVLSGQAEISRYAREMGGYDNWRAGVTLDIPLQTSGKKKAVVAKYNAELIQAKAELEQKRRDLRQSLQKVRDELKTLETERQSVKVYMDYRDLYLDRSRAIYQMEVKSDLGDSAAKIMDAKVKVMKNKFDNALAWARVEAMLGLTVFSGEELTTNTVQEEQQ
ncbi:TolC family protein [Kaarinaea lacus]